MPEESSKPEDGVDIHVGGDFASKMLRTFLKHGLAPLIAAAAAGFGVHMIHVNYDHQAPEASVPVDPDHSKIPAHIAVLEAKVQSLDQHQLETDKNVNDIKINLAHMDGKLDGILAAVKGQQ